MSLMILQTVLSYVYSVESYDSLLTHAKKMYTIYNLYYKY